MCRFRSKYTLLTCFPRWDRLLAFRTKNSFQWDLIHIEKYIIRTYIMNFVFNIVYGSLGRSHSLFAILVQIQFKERHVLHSRQKICHQVVQEEKNSQDSQHPGVKLRFIFNKVWFINSFLFFFAKRLHRPLYIFSSFSVSKSTWGLLHCHRKF